MFKRFKECSSDYPEHSENFTVVKCKSVLGQVLALTILFKGETTRKQSSLGKWYTTRKYKRDDRKELSGVPNISEMSSTFLQT
jgi:hypothetical protein